MKKFVLSLIFLLVLSVPALAEDKAPALTLKGIPILYDDGDSETRVVADGPGFYLFQMLSNLSVMENTPGTSFKGISFLFFGVSFTDYKNEPIFDGEKFVKSGGRK